MSDHVTRAGGALAALSLVAGLAACAEDVDVEPVDPHVCDYTGVWRVTLRDDDFKEVDHDWRLEVSDEPGRERVSLTVEGLDCVPGEHWPVESADSGGVNLRQALKPAQRRGQVV